ncbi:MAG: hypothetical protein J6T30_00580, partial [Bacteroidales bacterium]|nr:hypothetical protein [Bacteroidales bacterium]
MEKIRSYILPLAIVLGLLLHKWCSMFIGIAPYLVFAMLLLNFTAVDIRKLKMSVLDVWLMLFQIVVSIGMYYLLVSLGANEIVAQGVLVGIICPVAASVVVIACILGANRETVTAYTIIGNLMVAIVAPIFFSFTGTHKEMLFWTSFFLILKRVGTIIGLPFIIALLLQIFSPKMNDRIKEYKGITFYLWALALLVTLGRTIDFIFLYGKENISSIIWLGVFSIVFCVIQFGFGKWLGNKYGDKLAGGQLLGQKNT